MASGWSLLKREAPFERDYLLPGSTRNYGSFEKQDLKYAVGSAIQTRVLSILKVGEEPLFRHRVVHCWTPYSGWNFLAIGHGCTRVCKAGARSVGRRGGLVGAREREVHEVGQAARLNDAGSRLEGSPGPIES